MKKIFIINGGQIFGHSGGQFNETIAKETARFFENQEGLEIKTTNINEEYSPAEEVAKFIWADVIIYHTPIWWFQLPNKLKKYIDVVFTEGHGTIYKSDGRRSANPTRNYGTGGLLQGKKYIVTSTWNAPLEAFTLVDEFFDQHSVDEGVLFGFHKMNAFVGMEKLGSFHFYDVMKNPALEENLELYKNQLSELFTAEYAN